MAAFPAHEALVRSMSSHHVKAAFGVWSLKNRGDHSHEFARIISHGVVLGSLYHGLAGYTQ